MKIIHIFNGIVTDDVHGVQIPYNEMTAHIYKSVLDVKKAKKADKCR